MPIFRIHKISGWKTQLLLGYAPTIRQFQGFFRDVLSRQSGDQILVPLKMGDLHYIP